MPRGTAKPRVAVWDLDGTLADASRRVARLDRDNPDWDDHHHDIHEDPVLRDQRALLQICEDAGLATIILTARPEKYREMTEWWLARHGIFPDAVLMRSPQDSIKTAEYKATAIDALLSRFIIELVVDDHIEVIEVARQRGIPALYVHSYYYTQGELENPKCDVSSGS